MNNDNYYIDGFISDEIPYEDIELWIGKNVLIEADTGMGKTTFIDKKVAVYAESIDKKILYLCNRTFLKFQVICDLGKHRNVQVCTYQYFEEHIEEIDDYLDDDDYILVLDEAHYFATDSKFNQANVKMFTKLIDSSNTKILMTATPEPLPLDDLGIIDIPYKFKRDMKAYIENYYCYYNIESIIKKIKSIPDDEKVLFVCNSVETIRRIYNEVPDKAQVLVSSNRKSIYDEFNCKKVSDEIVNESSFSSKILLATPCLDNGISLRMRELKHIIVLLANPVILKQALGRKRFIDKEDKVNLYIGIYNNRAVAGMLNSILHTWEAGQYLIDNGAAEFCQEYDFKSYDTRLIYHVDSVLTLNICFWYSVKYEYKYLTEMKESSYLQYICEYLNLEYYNFISLEYNHDYEMVKSIFLKYNGQRLYIDTQEHNEIADIFTNKLLSYKEDTFGFKNLTKFIELMNQNDNYEYFTAKRGQGTIRPKERKGYWILSYTDMKEDVDIEYYPENRC